MRSLFKKCLSIILPTIFILYMGSVISFTHVHIINGVTIVHSHPYHKNADGTEHEHTGMELQMLHQLSTILQVGSCLFEFQTRPFYITEKTLICQPVFHTYSLKIARSIQLRAPPISVFHIL